VPLGVPSEVVGQQTTSLSGETRERGGKFPLPVMCVRARARQPSAPATVACVRSPLQTIVQQPLHPGGDKAPAEPDGAGKMGERYPVGQT